MLVIESQRDYTHALVVSGQGSQRPLMGLALAQRSPAAMAVWQKADIALKVSLGRNLSEIVWKGTEADLMRTEVAHPGVIVDASAREQAGKEARVLGVPGWHGGNSLGFIGALLNSGVIKMKDAIKLGEGRTRAFRYAIDNGPKTTMLALSDVDAKLVEDLQLKFDGIVLCLVNTDTQFVVGGTIKDINAVSAYLKTNGLEDNATQLLVDAAFHSEFMRPAISLWEDVVGETIIEAPKFGRLVGGSTVTELLTPVAIREELVSQFVNTERYRDVSIFFKNQGVITITELSALPLLTRMNLQNYGGGERRRIEYPAVNGNGRGILIAHRFIAKV